MNMSKQTCSYEKRSTQETYTTLMERWGAGVETHFQEISWNLRPVLNGT